MNEKTKLITINDNGIEKNFIVQKMGALRLVKFNHKILSALNGLRDIDSQIISNIKQSIFSILQTGERDTNADIKSISPADILPNLYTIIQGLLTNISDELQDGLLSEFFEHISYLNDGVNPTRLNTNPYSLEYVDHHISNMETVYKLCWEVLKLNYEGSIQRFFL